MISDTIKQFQALHIDGHARYQLTDDSRLVLFKNKYCQDKGCIISEEVMLNTSEQELIDEIAYLETLKTASQSMLAVAYP